MEKASQAKNIFLRSTHMKLRVEYLNYIYILVYTFERYLVDILTFKSQQSNKLITRKVVFLRECLLQFNGFFGFFVPLAVSLLPVTFYLQRNNNFSCLNTCTYRVFHDEFVGYSFRLNSFIFKMFCSLAVIPDVDVNFVNINGTPCIIFNSLCPTEN